MAREFCCVGVPWVCVLTPLVFCSCLCLSWYTSPLLRPPDVRPALQMLNKLLEQDPVDPALYADWRKELEDVRTKFPMRYPDREDVIAPQHAIEVWVVACWGDYRC